MTIKVVALTLGIIAGMVLYEIIKYVVTGEQ